MSYTNKIIKMFQEGISKNKISRELGIHRRSVFNCLKRHGVLDNIKQLQQNEPADIIANKRSLTLSETLHHIITKSQWPVINPEALIVESRLNSYYDSFSGLSVEKPGAPAVYVTDVLRTKKINDYKGKIFFFTRAQNATPVHEQLLKNMEAYAKERGADIVIGPSTYETSWWNESAEHSRSYDKRIEKYLCFGRMDIGDNFFFGAETNIIATASAPISDLISYSQGKWCVIPHPKQNLVSIPITDPNKTSPQILSTGSITVPKVIAKKAGLKSIFHHIFGFVVVEFDKEGNVFCRHVNAEEDGSFYDLKYFVENTKPRFANKEKDKPDYIMPGDIHCGKLDLANKNDVLGTFGFYMDDEYCDKDDNLIGFLEPKRVILQDLHDGNVDDHHSNNDIGQRVENKSSDNYDLRNEVIDDGFFLYNLEKYHPFLEEIIVDESNHDLRLLRYVREGRYRTDENNIRFCLQLEDRYLEYRELCGNNRKSKGLIIPKFSLHEYAVRKEFPDFTKVTWIYDGDSRIINGVECGHHGFRGVNGSKACLTGYARMGCKISYGDKHAAAILDGAFQAGTMGLHHRYNIGPSSWTVSHILQYANGKRCIITMQGGNFCYKEKGNPFYKI